MSSIDAETAEHIREIFTANKTDTKVKKTSSKAKAEPKKKAAPKVKAKAEPKKKVATKKAATKKKETTTTAAKAVKKPKEEEKSKATVKAKELTKIKAPLKTEKPAAKKKAAPATTTRKAAAKAPEEPKEVKPKKLGLKIIKAEEKVKGSPVKAAPQPKSKKPAPPKPKPKETKPKVATPVQEAPETAAVGLQEEEVFETVSLRDGMSVRELGETLKCTANEIIKELMHFGVMATINQSLDTKISSKVADKLGFEVVVEEVAPDLEINMEEEEIDLPEHQIPRAPIVTIMGHVDHGKTSLLDAIRETNITEQEHGGITQHIGAYQVMCHNSLITFLDTPGHEAFTAMRARGTQVTDIVILVVAADDGIKPQTKEAMDHAKAAEVPIIVAINKIDKHDAKPEEVKKQLADLGLLPEDWGGTTIFTEVSALKKTGIEHLLEMILLQTEILELKSNPKLRAKGVVIESKLDKRRGPVATVMVQKGTLRVGSPYIMGCYFGKVRALLDHQSRKIKEAGPSTPVEVLGLSDVPQPGDNFMVVENEKKARQLSNTRIQRLREYNLAQSTRITLEDLHQQIKEGKIKELNLIVKADVQGSIQAVQEAFSKLETKEVRIKIIHDSVGGITESDVLLSSASNAIIIGFNVRPTEKAAQLADKEKVDIRLYTVIYDAISDMKKAMDGLLEPTFKEKIVGRAEVRKIFTVPKLGVIAGCQVLSGMIERNNNARLIRDSVVVYQGKINSLRRFKDDVKSVLSGYECGLSLDKYQDLKEGDIVEPYTLEEISR